MPGVIQLLGTWIPLETEVVTGMIALSGLKKNEKFIDLGCGDGRFLLAAKQKQANPIIGYEINHTLASNIVIQGVTVIEGDLFDADVSTADVVTFWFTVQDTINLFNKLYAEMKTGARLVMLHDSVIEYPQNGSPIVKGYFINHVWQPETNQTILGNRFYLYRK